MDRYVVRERLRNGTEVTVRAVRPDDAPKIQRAFKALDRETIYSRFFGYKQDVSDDELRRFTGVDFKRDVALLVTVGSENDEIVIGGASYFGSSSVRRAEMAFVVEEDYQGLGVGTCLLRHLTVIARKNGVTHLEADVLANNHPMLEVFRRSGLSMTVRPEANVVHVVLEIPAAAPSRY